jgi:hypothetical protein
MATNWVTRNKKLLVIAGVPVLVLAWWLFRPEKLFVNQRVNEPATFASADQPAPIFTGKFEARKEPTKGRATIYQSSDGTLELRLTDFQTANGEELHVLLVSPDDKALEQMETKSTLTGSDLGMLRNSMEQRLSVPVGSDLTKLSAVVIYSEKSSQVLGVAKLEAF